MRHLLNGIEVSPRNRDSIGVVSDFTGNPDVLSLNIDSVILPREANEYIKNWIQNNGLFIGIPYTVEMDGNISLDYYIDLSDSSAKPIVRQHEIEVKLKRRNGSDTFWEKARGTSFDLMYKEKGAAYFNYKNVGYYVVTNTAAMDALNMSIALFMLTVQIIDAYKQLAEAAVDFVANPLSGAAKFAIKLIYFASLLTAMATLMAKLFPIIFPRKKYFKGCLYSEIFTKGCDYLGYTALPSSIFQEQPGWLTLPVPLDKNNESFFDKTSNDLADSYNKPVCSASDTTPTFGAWLDEILKQFNAKLFIDAANKTVRLERRDWLQQQTSLQIDPALNIQPERDDQYTYNTEEVWKRYYITYSLDYTDTHTIDGEMFGRNQAEYATNNNVSTPNQDLVTIKGLNEVRINFALGAPKNKLTLLENLAIPFVLLYDATTQAINQAFGGTGTNLYAQILDRKNAMKISNEYFGVTKSLYVKSVGSGNKVNLDTVNYDVFYSATKLWDNFHYINFIANNDFIIHEEARIRLKHSQFVSLQNSNYIFTNNKWCEVLRIEWIDEKSLATITYKEPFDWANGKVLLEKID